MGFLSRLFFFPEDAGETLFEPRHNANVAGLPTAGAGGAATAAGFLAPVETSLRLTLHAVHC